MNGNGHPGGLIAPVSTIYVDNLTEKVYFQTNSPFGGDWKSMDIISEEEFSSYFEGAYVTDVIKTQTSTHTLKKGLVCLIFCAFQKRDLTERPMFAILKKTSKSH